MGQRDTESALTCNECGAKISSAIVRGMTSVGHGLYCPACSHELETVDTSIPSVHDT